MLLLNHIGYVLENLKSGESVDSLVCDENFLSLRILPDIIRSGLDCLRLNDIPLLSEERYNVVNDIVYVSLLEDVTGS